MKNFFNWLGTWSMKVWIRSVGWGWSTAILGWRQFWIYKNIRICRRPMDIQTSMDVPRQVWCPLGSPPAVPRNCVQVIWYLHIYIYMYFSNLASLDPTRFLLFFLMRRLQSVAPLVPPAPFFRGFPSLLFHNPEPQHPVTHFWETNTSNAKFAHATFVIAEFAKAIYLQS